MTPTPEYELRGTLSAYARWAQISLDAAKKRNQRGHIVFCKKYPHLVDFVASNKAAQHPGRPRTSSTHKKIRISWWVDATEYAELGPIHRKYQRIHKTKGVKSE